MKHTKRLLCLLLIACMLLAIVPAQVFARNTVRAEEDVRDEDFLAYNEFYLASTGLRFDENTPSDWQLRIGRGGDCREPASVTVKLEDFSAHYGKDYTVISDGREAVCPENPIAIIDLFSGDYTVERQMNGEELNEDEKQAQTEAMAQANALVREMTGIETVTEDAPLSSLEQARAAQTGIEAPQQRITTTEQTEEQLRGLTDIFGDIIPGATLTVEFAAGESEKFLTICPKDNTDADGSRYFTVRLVDPTGAETSSADSCAVTILDDEEIAPCEVSFGEITQNGDTLTVNVERTGCVNQITHLKLVSRQDGTAVEGRDFSKVETDVLFPMGAPATQITIPISTDWLTADADFSLELEPVVNAEVEAPTKRVELKAGETVTVERNLGTANVNEDAKMDLTKPSGTRHSGNFDGILGYNAETKSYQMQWEYYTCLWLPYWGYTEATYQFYYPERYYNGARVTFDKTGSCGEFSIGWGTMEDIIEDDDFEWQGKGLTQQHNSTNGYDRTQKTFYYPEGKVTNESMLAPQPAYDKRTFLRFINEGNCTSCDLANIYEIVPIYRWYTVDLVTDDANAPQFLTETGKRAPDYDAATAGIIGANTETPNHTLFHLNDTLRLTQKSSAPYCKLTSLSTLDGTKTFELTDNGNHSALLMDEKTIDALIESGAVEWKTNPLIDQATTNYGAVTLRPNFEYTSAEILVKDSEDGNYGTLRLSGEACPASDETYKYHRGDVIRITCDIDPITAEQVEMTGVNVRFKKNASDINWMEYTVRPDSDGNFWLQQTDEHRLEYGYYEITPVFNYKYNTATVRVEKDAIDQFDQSYGIFTYTNPKTVNVNGVTYLQYIIPNVQNGKIYSFSAKGRDNTYCPVWREDRDPKAVNYSGECFYYTARDASDKNIIYLTTVHRPAGYSDITIQGTLLRNGYNAKTGFVDGTAGYVEGAIAICGESSCRTDENGAYTLKARCPSGNSVRYLLSVNGQTALREVVASRQTVTDTAILNPENGTVIGNLTISFAETDATDGLLMLDGSGSKLIVSDNGGSIYQQGCVVNGMTATQDAVERLTDVKVIIRDTNGEIRATYQAEHDEENDRFTCTLPHSDLYSGDRVFLKLTTDRLADTLVQYDTEGNVLNPDVIVDKGSTEYGEVFSGYSFAPTTLETVPVTQNIDFMPKYILDELPLIGETGYDFNLGPVNLAIEERDGEYIMRFGISFLSLYDMINKTHATSYAWGQINGQQMYSGMFTGDGGFVEQYLQGIGNALDTAHDMYHDYNNGDTRTIKSLGTTSWRFDILFGMYIKFTRLELVNGGVDKSDFYMTGMGAYLGAQVGVQKNHYFVIPLLNLPGYLGFQIDLSVVGTLGGGIDRNNLEKPLVGLSDATNGYVNLGQWDQLDGSIRACLIGNVYAGAGLCGVVGIRVGGRLIVIGLWEPAARDSVSTECGALIQLGLGGWIDAFVMSIPIVGYFDPWRFGIFEEYQNQTNKGVSLKAGDMAFRAPLNEEASVWKGSRPATRSAFSEQSVQTLVENPYENPEAKLLSLKNGDVLLAYIDKLDTDDLIDRTVLKLARYRDGKWGQPVTVQNDERADFQPSLCETKDGKVLVSWVSTDADWERDGTTVDFLKSLDVFSAVIDPETMTVSDLTQLTDDEYYDSTPIAVCDQDSGEWAVYYTKASAEGATADSTKTAEELLNVYSNGSIIAYQLHADAGDGKGARWLFDYYFPSEYATEADRDYLIENWNGQRFLAAPIEDLDIAAANIADLTVTTYNGLSALAYTVDADSSNDTSADKELFVQYYRFHDHKLFVPVRLTDDSVSDAIPQFARSIGEGAETMLFWLREDKHIAYLSVSELIREGTDDDGSILDTYRVGENDEPSDDLTRLYSYVKPGGKEPSEDMQWSSFRTAVTDKDIYVIWSQAVEESPETVELYATAIIRSDETEKSGTDWSNPYRLTCDGRIADTPYLALDTNGDLIAVYNSYTQEVTEDPENPLIIEDLRLCAATLVPCGAVEVSELDLSDLTPEPGQTVDIALTLVNNGLTFAEGYELTVYAGDTVLETYTSHARMRPAQKARFAFNMTVPEDFEGMTVRAVVKELGGAWTNTHEMESEPLQKTPALEILNPVTYQDKTGIRMSFDVINIGNAVSTEEDIFNLTQSGPYCSTCGLSLDEMCFAEQSMAGIASGEIRHFDIAVNAPEKAFEQFGYVTCVAEILHGEETMHYTAIDIKPEKVLDIQWNGGELPETLTMHVGDSVDASVTAVPAGSGYVTLYSSDPEVAEVENGKLVAKGEGTAEITGILLPSGEIIGPITVTVGGEEEPFIDVHKTSWFHDAVLEAYHRGLMVGMTENTFEPNGTMSRAMLVAVLHRMQGSPAPEGTASFTDVPAGAWYTDAVLWAAENGIVSGMGGGKFAPNDPVTREQFVAILFRYANWRGADTENRAELDFSDASKVSLWARNAVEWAVAENLLSGNLNGGVLTLDPKGKATRAQGASLLIRFLKNILNE